MVFHFRKLKHSLIANPKIKAEKENFRSNTYTEHRTIKVYYEDKQRIYNFRFYNNTVYFTTCHLLTQPKLIVK